eukprot:CAMPEP_0184500092 /NCGR_PEP_ID=MMETSP0113_2-20130426/43617_1 /TAXON_ID=91329 /ORGANISM="Norrisiella sphaerica, Strain BC52" /LENGTH=491 /DNA_ID=CAMNT_0026888311 /DNA_START=69 /DNA_END=1545 /DNA_ORIENTATION=-
MRRKWPRSSSPRVPSPKSNRKERTLRYMIVCCLLSFLLGHFSCSLFHDGNDPLSPSPSSSSAASYTATLPARDETVSSPPSSQNHVYRTIKIHPSSSTSTSLLSSTSSLHSIALPPPPSSARTSLSTTDPDPPSTQIEPSADYVASTDVHEFGEVIIISGNEGDRLGSYRHAEDRDLQMLSRNRKRLELLYFAAHNKSGLSEPAAKVANWDWDGGETAPIIIYRRKPQRHPSFESYVTWWLEKSRSNWFLSDAVMVYENFFRNQDKGFFLEVGGNTGKEGDSMTWIFRKKGWDGIAIEAAPLLYAQLHTDHKGLSSMEGALCDSFKVVEFVGQSGCCAGIKTEMSESHIGAFLSNEIDDDASRTKVNCVTLTTATEALGVQVIDFLSLDVEGAELSVLKGVDWARIQIRAILVEVGGDEKKDEELRSLLRSKGFSKHDFKSVSSPALNELWIQRATLKQLSPPPPSSHDETGKGVPPSATRAEQGAERMVE